MKIVYDENVIIGGYVDGVWIDNEVVLVMRVIVYDCC